MYHANPVQKILKPLMAGAIAVVGLSLPAFAETAHIISQAPPQLRKGECRMVNKQVAVFADRDLDKSGALRLLNRNTEVKLAEDRQNDLKLIAIEGGGYVQTANLTFCPNALCRRVNNSAGLNIREKPGSNIIGTVPDKAQVTLTSDPPIRESADNQDWIQISAPKAGWVSNGTLNSGTSNLVMCQ